jgi:hypothetical protein
MRASTPPPAGLPVRRRVQHVRRRPRAAAAAARSPADRGAVPDTVVTGIEAIPLDGRAVVALRSIVSVLDAKPIKDDVVDADVRVRP